jgi:broad specificity phosphatase PhoE
MSNIDYLSKYIKYKTKYLDIINQDGGTYKPIIIFICTHGKTIRYLLNNLGIISAKIFKLKNCAILRFEINKNNMTIELVYEGEVKNNTKSENKYYTLKNNKELNNKELNNSKIFNKKILYDDKSYNSLHIKRNDLRDDIYIFYLMRHGDKIKNITKSIINDSNTKSIINDSNTKSIINDSITKKGILQAQKAGIFLKAFLQNYNEKINFYFTSKLYRTQQSLFYAVGKHKIIIIPCLYQLDLLENKSVKQENTINNEIKKNGILYNNFYNLFFYKKKCDFTTIISLSIFVIKEIKEYKTDFYREKNIYLIEEIKNRLKKWIKKRELSKLYE